jgi:hypothetical protein
MQATTIALELELELELELVLVILAHLGCWPFTQFSQSVSKRLSTGYHHGNARNRRQGSPRAPSSSTIPMYGDDHPRIWATILIQRRPALYLGCKHCQMPFATLHPLAVPYSKVPRPPPGLSDARFGTGTGVVFQIEVVLQNIKEDSKNRNSTPAKIDAKPRRPQGVRTLTDPQCNVTLCKEMEPHPLV